MIRQASEGGLETILDGHRLPSMLEDAQNGQNGMSLVLDVSWINLEQLGACPLLVRRQAFW